jgi:hypothetical protein
MDLPSPDSLLEDLHLVDPDTAWTVWALGTLREVVAIDLRTAHRIERQQDSAAAEPDRPSPDFALMQSRLARSIRLSVAMTERIRAAHKDRKAAKGEAAARRRQQRRMQVGRAVVAAIGADFSIDTREADRLRVAVRESLTETETPDIEIDTQPLHEILLRICRRLGRTPPDWASLPQAWEDDIEAGPAEAPLGERDETVAAEPRTGEDFPSRRDVPGDAGPPIWPAKADSS